METAEPYKINTTGIHISKALDLVQEYLKDVPGTQYCLKIDISKFYPNIDHEILKQLLTSMKTGSICSMIAHWMILCG